MSTKSKVQLKAALAAKHQKNIAAFFRQQKAMVLRALTRRTLSARQETGRELESPSLWSMSADEWENIWQGITDQTTPALKTVITSAEADGLHAGANGFKLAMKGKVPDNTFNLANPRAVAWFMQNGGSVDYIKGIQKTTGNQIKGIINDALESGQAYTKTAKQIADTFDGMSRDRAQRIAVYETGKAYEQGNFQLVQSLKDDGIVMEKMWMTSHDEKVRPEHAANEAQGWIPLDEYFQSGDFEPPTDPGCRCYLVYQEVRENA